MKTCIRITVCLLLVTGFSLWGGAQEKVASQITIVVPEKGHAETAVNIFSKEEFPGSRKATAKDFLDRKLKVLEGLYIKNLGGEGGTRVYKVALPKDKEHKFKIEAVIQPTNYETITRYKEITLKGGDNAKVDLTVKLPTDRTFARYVPTPDDIVDEMAKLAKVTKDDVIFDLGCGDGRMLIRPVQKFGAKRGVGIDLDPDRVAEANKNVKEAKLGDKVEIRKGDILDVNDMSDATLVLLYIGDVLGERLSPVLRRTLKPGARIVSHRFKLGDWQPTKTVTVKGADTYEYELHLWVVGEKKEKK